jgi:hypothetical protein
MDLTRWQQRAYVIKFTLVGSKPSSWRRFCVPGEISLDRMREQRVKQITSRIVEAALGVGIERDRVWDNEKKKWRYPKRPRELLYHVDEQGVAHGDPRFKTCHAVVIENLRNYRPDELATEKVRGGD